MGAFADCALSTSLIILANVVSVPNAVVSTSNKPSTLTEPPVTVSPTFLTTGRLSPVINDSST